MPQLKIAIEGAQRHDEDQLCEQTNQGSLPHSLHAINTDE